MVKRAVVVGVNDYSTQDPSGKSNLSSCVNDAQSMYYLLVDAFGFDPSQIFYYVDNDASRSNILQALRYITSTGEAGDVACFYYSGHGAKIRADPAKVDSSKYYEAIVPASGDWITDWEVFQIANDLQQSVVNFTLILDSCHSGGQYVADATQRARSLVFSEELMQNIVQNMKTQIPCGICLPPDANLLDNNVRNVSATPGGPIVCEEDPDKQLVPLSKASLIAACRFSEYSWEDQSLGHGLMTQSFLDIVNSSNFQTTYNDLLNQLRTKTGDYINSKIAPGHPGTTQVPQLRGQQNRMQEEFLGAWSDSH